MASPQMHPSIQEEIIRLTREFRVTIVHGETGCGKSTLVPQLLLDKGMDGRNDQRRILCSQPRRLAAVAIAERVASLRGCALGGEVGYAIGQRIVATPSTRLLFCTAGTLLEKIRSRGERSLSNVRYVVIDEVHERSSENDLLIASLKQMLVFAAKRGRKGGAGGARGDQHMRRLNLVIMSATFDVERYKRYFSDIPDAGVRLVTLQTMQGGGRGQGLGAALSSRTTIKNFYLEQAVRFLNDLDPENAPSTVKTDRERVLRSHPMAIRDGGGVGGSGGPSSGASVSDQLLRLAADLVVAQGYELAGTEQVEKRPLNSLGILVFLPTFRQIEQLAVCIESSRKTFVALLLERLANKRIRLGQHSARDLAAEAAADKEVMSAIDNGSGDDDDDDDGEAESEDESEKWRRKAARCAKLEVIVLHSSMDVEETQAAFVEETARRRRKKRRIFLATTIAESSITIPHVALVVDLARTNRVFWDPCKCPSSPLRPDGYSTHQPNPPPPGLCITAPPLRVPHSFFSFFSFFSFVVSVAHLLSLVGVSPRSPQHLRADRVGEPRQLPAAPWPHRSDLPRVLLPAGACGVRVGTAP